MARGGRYKAFPNSAFGTEGTDQAAFHCEIHRPPSGRLGRTVWIPWKAIAAPLGATKTVQRWEKREGMPVHRHVYDKNGSVSAFRTDLDAWREGAV